MEMSTSTPSSLSLVVGNVLVTTSERVFFPWHYSLMVSPLFCPHLLLLKPIHDAKAPGDDRKALTIPLPQMRSTTQTRALLNTNAPNLPQLLMALAVHLGPSRWSPCVPKPAAEILKRRRMRERRTTTGPPTVQRLHGMEYHTSVFCY